MADYPPNKPPHRNDPAELSDAQCQENLDFLIETRDERLLLLTQMLAVFDLNIAAVTEPSAGPRPAFMSIDGWIRSQFPVPRESQPPRQRFLTSDRSGPEILFSLVADLGILEGEAIVRRRDDFNWALDLDSHNPDMPSFRRPRIVRPRLQQWASTVFDTQIIALQIAWHTGKPGAEIHPFGETAMAVLDGGYDPV